MGPAGALATHLGCAAVELACRVASRYVAPRDMGSGLVAGSRLEESVVILCPCHWMKGTLNTEGAGAPGCPDWLLFELSVGFTGGVPSRAQNPLPAFFQVG